MPIVKKYRLMAGDLVSLGLTDDFRVMECTANKTADNQKQLLMGDESHVNIRYVPNENWEAPKEFIECADHYGDPKLTIEFVSTCGKLYSWNQEKREDDGLPPTFTLPADQETKIGRLSKKNNLAIPSGKVSRGHAVIAYEEGFGWMLWEQDQGADKPYSTSGTWVHPKTYSKAIGGDNSNPVLMQSGMRVKASSFIFEFKIEQA